MIFQKTFLILFLVFVSSYSFALPKANPVPGGLTLIPLPHQGNTPPKAFFKNKRLAIVSDQQQHYALVGIPLGTDIGKQHIVLQWPDGKKEFRDFQVEDKTYKAQYLTIKNKRKVNPNEQDMKRIVSERGVKRRARTFWSDEDVKTDFIIPVEGRISSIFGLRRFFNQQPRRPHSGLDIAAPEGTPIRAVESGTVIEASNFFFSGNVVYIDHGQGLISMYAHMHSMDVKSGQKVSKGQVIGSVGQTGRVTGAHLHLGVIANQTLVDPVLLLPPLKNPESTVQ
jgi:murein DD-endopeptidase MepM/ murein hydrolase activator NlpD